MKDADFVEVQAQITLVEPVALQVSATPYRYLSGYNISCYECYNGSIDVTVDDGVPPYSYDWGDEVYTQDRSALGALPYAVSVTDANQCRIGSERITLTQPERSDWQMGGNANTDPAAQYLGTSDAQDVVFKSNGEERLRLTSDGQMKILGLGATGVLGIDADGTVGNLDLFDDVPCEDDLFPFWRTGGNNLLTCDATRPFIGSVDDRGFGFKSNNLVRMRLTAGGEFVIGSNLETNTSVENAGRVNVVSGNGNWLTLQTHPAGSTPNPYWALHNPPEQDRLMFYHQPVTGDPLYDVLTLHNDGRMSSHALTVFPEGKVSIGEVDIETEYDYGLYVHNGILTEKVKVAVKTSDDWSDYVFRKGYVLMPLNEVRDHIKKHGHLPGVPSADEMVEKGLDVAATDAMLLRKIEEITLHMIRMDDEMRKMRLENAELRKSLSSITSGGK
ncbi:MAG: SprB repeat-containing protein [Flavobacteriales bacterium]|nr:SprB repeat-containing protein [Flavobacteriales bacterium]